MLNNVGYALAVEKLCGLVVPERCQWYRMILGELARISDHLTCDGAMAMELGAFTPFLWFVKAREMVWDILEEETGARLTHSFGRIGGMAAPPTEDFKELCRAALPKILALVEEGEKMLLKNRIFIDRLEEVGVDQRRRCCRPRVDGAVPPRDAASRTTFARRTRTSSTTKSTSMSPSASAGDTWTASSCASWSSGRASRIILQSPDKMADDGPVNCDDPRVVLPDKHAVYTTIEATIQHFKLIMEGHKIPQGEVYSYTEGGNGELGFYLVSDGSGTPYRVRIRPPCFSIVGRPRYMLPGRMLSDIVPTFGSLNMIGGECDH